MTSCRLTEAYLAGLISRLQSHGVVSWTIIGMIRILLSAMKCVTKIPIIGIRPNSAGRLVNEFDNARASLWILCERG